MEEDLLLDIQESHITGTSRGLAALFEDEDQPNGVRPAVTRNTGLRFDCADIALLRATPYAQLDPPDWPDLDDATPEGVRHVREWLSRAWSIPDVTEALRHAAPAFASQLDHVASGAAPNHDAARRMALSLGSYLTRMTGRATPLGLLAGVAVASFDSKPAMRWGSDHRASAQASGSWLCDVIAQLEALDQVCRRLPIMLNNCVTVRGERLVVPWRPRPHDSASVAVQETSVLYTAPVQAVVGMTRGAPVLYEDVAAKLVADFPVVGMPLLHKMLDELLARRVLVSCLHPPGTTCDGLGFVLAQLERTGAAEVPQVCELVAELREIHQLMGQHGRLRAADTRGCRASLVGRMAAVSGAANPLALDVRLDCDVTLPRSVAREVQSAAAALTRISPHPYGTPAWRMYVDDFLERFGSGAVVPLLDVVDPDTGIGFPRSYMGSAPAPSAPLTRRDRRLLALAQAAALEGYREVELDDQLIEELSTGAPERMRAPAHLEIAFEVHAASLEELRRGDFRLQVAHTTKAIGTMAAGRFTSLLNPTGQEGHRDALRHLLTQDHTALAAQLSFPALAPRAAHLTHVPHVLPAIISLGEHQPPHPDVIPLSDIVVGHDNDRLYLASLSRGRRLEAVTLHPLNPYLHTPTLARFIAEIDHAQTATNSIFGDVDWGLATRELPFFPRIRHGRTVLSPARWLLHDTDLPGLATGSSQWDDAFATLRDQLRVPRAVLLTDWDQRLRLDLDHPGHRALLRSHLARHRQVTLIEAAPNGAFGWFDDRAHEVVALLTSQQQEPQQPVREEALADLPVVRRDHGHTPGTSTWLSALLLCRPSRTREILGGRLSDLLGEWDQPPQWWFTCQSGRSDGDEHVRLCIKAVDLSDVGGAMQRIGTWADRLVESGLLRELHFVPYRPEIGRWGTGAALEAAEAVFTTDSATVSQQFTHPRLSSYGLVAANIVAIAASFTGSLYAGLRWLIDQGKDRDASPLPRAVQKEALELASPAGEWEVLRTALGDQDLTAWATRAHALETYRHRLNDCAAPVPDTVLKALLHTHHLRAVGDDPTHERACLRLARAVALAHVSHPHLGGR